MDSFLVADELFAEKYRMAHTFYAACAHADEGKTRDAALTAGPFIKLTKLCAALCYACSECSLRQLGGHSMILKHSGLFSGLQMGMNMLRAGVIAQRIDISQAQYPGVVAAALFIVSPTIGSRRYWHDQL